MKAICVEPDRRLKLREVPVPSTPAPGHVFVDVEAAAITHEDKFFLTRPLPGATALTTGPRNVHGANGAGRVAALGEGVPPRYAGRKVAIYKSLSRSPEQFGVWCERAQVPFTSCLPLPDHVSATDYCGSLANVLTVHAFLAEIVAAGHAGLVVTAGRSATGLVAASLVQRRNVPAVFLVRSEAAREQLVGHGVEHVLLAASDTLEADLARLAAELRTTAVFDGVGGALLTRILPILPMNATAYVYGFLDRSTPISLSPMHLMGLNLTLRRFANLESATVSEPDKLAVALEAIEVLIDDPLLKTRVGREFRLDQIDDAIAYEAADGARVILVV